MILFSLATATIAFGQTEQKTTANPGDKDFPTTLQPVNPVKYYGPRKEKKKKKSKSATYNARSEYEDRIEASFREQEKREKRVMNNEADCLMPPYFGHRKPPKVRPINKRKYCKICGIRH